MADLPSRLAAALEDRYRIERELGEGGMATVYLAHDLRHDRKVALKVLRPELAAVIGAERFLAEIRTTANLQHPHILPLFDSGEADSFLFYVMPYVEGETLRDRLSREKHLPIDDALRIAGGVASALDYAHRRDIIHRDIKPENILLHDGQPLVADFGIALALSTAGGSRMTETGMSLGTPTYMSPEQAMGEREIDARADIYSLGCVVYEMLTGDPPFTGSTAQAIAARMLTEPPRPLTTQRHTVPPHVEAAVLTALEKLPADRFPTAEAFAAALKDGSGLRARAAAGPGSGASTVGRRATFHNPVVWVLTALTLLSSGLALRQWLTGRAVQPDAVVRFQVDLPPGFQPFLSDAQGPDVAVSRDGSTVAFPALDTQGARKMYVRRLDESAARPLAGTEGGYLPAFSPDGMFLAFWTAGRIQRVSVDGGAPQLVGEYGNTNSLTWTDGGELLFNQAGVGSLMRVPLTGGEARRAAPIDSIHGETAQFYPVVVPGGRYVLYQSWGRGAAEDARVGILDLAEGRARRLDLPGTTPLGMMDGRLIFADQAGTLLAVQLDLASGETRGQPMPVGDGVATGARGSGIAALSGTGTLVYQGGSLDAKLVLADPQGQTPVLSDARAYSYPRFSPDGKQIALTIASGTSSDIWLDDVATGSLMRLTTGGAVNERPEWSPDGSRVLFRSVRGARSAIWWQPADKSGPATPLLADDRGDYFEGVLTPDGRSLVYQVDTAQADVWVREVGSKDAPRPIAVTEVNDDQARISPDGQWVALVTTESGAPQVVVYPLRGPGGRVQVSVRGGSEPVWSRDGRRIFYRTEGEFRVAEVSSVPTFHVVSRSDFMADTFMPSLAPHANYDVTPDGKKLLVLKGEPPQLMVVHGWEAEVRARLGREESR